jgi:hypothetical protein
MSKVVRSVGKAVSGVVKGVTKTVKSVVKGVGGVIKKIASSPIGKALLVAATIYFGGAAIMGAMGGAGASTGFFGTIGGAIKGAGAGIANAWSGLTAASSAAMAGNFGTAGSSLSQGFMGANAAGAGAVGGVSAVPMNIAAGTQASGAVTAPIGSSAVAAQPLAPAASGGGLVNTAAQQAANPGFWASNTGAATVLAGGQLAGNVIAGAGQAKAAEEQRAYEEAKLAEELARRDENMRTEFQFGASGEGGNYAPRGESSQYAGMPYRPFPGGPAQLQARGGLISSQINTPQGQFGYNFPTYNPALGRYGFA